MDTAPNPHLLHVLTIVATQGLKGDVRANVFVEDISILREADFYHEDGSSASITLKHQKKKQLVLAMEGIFSIEEAKNHIGTELFIHADALPAIAPEEDAFYPHELIGKVLKNEAGEQLGVVEAVQNFGAGDILVYGKEMLSFDADTIVSINEADIIVRLPEEIMLSQEEK